MNGRSKHFGSYFLSTDNSGNPFEEHLSFANWVGMASTQTPNHPVCSDFLGVPLPFQIDDATVPELRLAQGQKALVFDSGASPKSLVFGTVLYSPQPLFLSHAGDQTELVTPDGKLARAGEKIQLDFSAQEALKRPNVLPNGLQVDSLQKMVDLFNTGQGALCLKTEEKNDGSTRTVLFWNKAKLLQEVLDKQNTPFSPNGTNRRSVIPDFSGINPATDLCS